MFAGGGLTYTPVDDDARGKLFSLQLGVSYEQTFASEVNGVPQADSGASGIFSPMRASIALRTLQTCLPENVTATSSISRIGDGFALKRG